MAPRTLLKKKKAPVTALRHIRGATASSGTHTTRESYEPGKPAELLSFVMNNISNERINRAKLRAGAPYMTQGAKAGVRLLYLFAMRALAQNTVPVVVGAQRKLTRVRDIVRACKFMGKGLLWHGPL
jgi:hypothetical protein